MSGHTSGPWRVVRHHKPAQVKSMLSVGFTANGMASIAWLTGGAIHQDANAALISASPDLLSFARGYINSQDPCVIGGDSDPEKCECVACSLTREARAAIAKAEGRS